MHSHLHPLHPPPSRGKGSVTSRSSSSTNASTPQSSNLSLRTAVAIAVADADTVDLSNKDAKMSRFEPHYHRQRQQQQQRSASGETAVDDIVPLGDVSATELIGQLRFAERGASSDADSTVRSADILLSTGDPAQSSSGSATSRPESLPGDSSVVADDVDGDEPHVHAPTSHAALPSGRRPQDVDEHLGRTVKPLPNGLSRAMPSVLDTDCSHDSEFSRQPESSATETGYCSGEQEEEEEEVDEVSGIDGARQRKNFTATTPKLGGFGVRDDHVPHVKGMRSAATDRAKKHEEEAAALRSRQWSKSDSRDSQANEGRSLSLRGPSSSSSNLIGKKQDQPPESTEWGANFWCVITDPKTQASFFANPQTGECHWEVPAGTIVLPPNPDGEWWELYDEERALPYYYHTQTAKSDWVRPKGFVIPLTAIQESTLGRTFSRKEFGEERISARASMLLSDDTVGQGATAVAGDTAKASTSSSAPTNGHSKAHAQPPPPSHSPGIEQVLAGKARRRIMGADRALVAQALARQPLLTSTDIAAGRAVDATARSASYGQGVLSPRSRHNMRVAFDGKTYGKMRPEIAKSNGGGGIQRRMSSHSLSSSRQKTVPSLDSSLRRSRSKTVTYAGIPRSVTKTSLSMRHGLSSRSMRESASDPQGLISDAASTSRGDGSGSLLSEPKSPVRRTIRRERDPVKRLSPIESLRSKSDDTTAATKVEVKRLSTGDHLCMPSALQSEIKMLAFESFALRKFTTHRVGPFRRKLPLDKMARWQKNAINAPLLHLDFKELQKDAVKIFKVVQRIMGDRDGAVHAKPPTPVKPAHTARPKAVPAEAGLQQQQQHHTSPRMPRMASFSAFSAPSPTLPDCMSAARSGRLMRPSDGADADESSSSPWSSSSSRPPSILEEEGWLLERGVQSVPLRDEIYAQLIKQLTDNPNASSIFRGWQLLCVALITFPPGNDLRDYLRRFIESHADDADEAISSMAHHCIGRLALICRRGARESTPTIAEIQTAGDAAFSPGVFGHSLKAIMATQRDAYPHVQVPIVLVFLCNALLAVDALKTEGVFRVAGDDELVTELKVRIERGHYRLDGIIGTSSSPGEVGSSEGDVAVLATLLKIWLRELEESLIAPSLYERCIGVSEQPSRCIDLVRTLSVPARWTLIYLISFLQLFTQPSAIQRTKMSAETLALVFAPVIFCKKPERLSVLFNNSKYEQHFVLSLLRHLPCGEVDGDFRPVHATQDGTVARREKVNVRGAGRGHGKSFSSSAPTTTATAGERTNSYDLCATGTEEGGWSSERSIFDSPVRLKPHGAPASATARERREVGGSSMGLRHGLEQSLETVEDVS